MSGRAAQRGRAPLLVSIHDVAPRWLPEVQALRRALHSWGARRVTLLAVPHFHRGVRLTEHADTCRWLRDCAAGGDEIALHGYYHQQSGPPTASRARLRARLWTAGEGECLSPDGDLTALLVRGRAELQDFLPARPGFVAPAWLEPPRLGARLQGLGFAWHETSMFVEALAPRRRLYAPVLGFATRTRLRTAAALAWSRGWLAATRSPVAGWLPVHRIAVHPGDLRSAPVMAALQRAVHVSAQRSAALTTAELLRG